MASVISFHPQTVLPRISMNLSRLNLNLLPGLKALLDTQSVSRAAQVMCVTQSAMSRTLGQLREALNDPILIRKGNHIYLSEKALSLHEEVNRVVYAASGIFENQQFDPATTERHFRIATGHMVLEDVMPGIIQKIWEQAPHFTFELLALHPGLTVSNGKIDIMVGYTGEPEDGLSSYKLMKEGVCIVLCENHPLANEPLSQEALFKYPFLMQKNGLNTHQLMSDYIRSLSHDVKIRALAPSIMSCLNIIKGSDCVFLATGSVQTFARSLEGVVVREVPMDVPEVYYSMVWSEYWALNRAHRWLREFVRNELTDFINARQLPPVPTA